MPESTQPSCSQCASASGRCPPSGAGLTVAEAASGFWGGLSERSRRWWAGRRAGARPRWRRNLMRPRLRGAAPSFPVRPGGRGGGGSGGRGGAGLARCGATCASWCCAWPAASARSSTPSASSPCPWKKERAEVAGSRRPKWLPGSRAADAARRERRATRAPQLIPAGRTGTGHAPGDWGRDLGDSMGAGTRSPAWSGLPAAGPAPPASLPLSLTPFHSFPSFFATPEVSPALLQPESSPRFCVCL